MDLIVVRVLVCDGHLQLARHARRVAYLTVDADCGLHEHAGVFIASARGPWYILPLCWPRRLKRSELLLLLDASQFAMHAYRCMLVADVEGVLRV
eukprot:6183838-Pleurochrysis_carterae.AAC.6